MSEVIGRRVVKTRKPHVCFGCGRKIPAGSQMERSCVADGILWTCYLCETCQEVSRELDYGDEYSFGDLRERTLEIEAQKGGNNDA